MILGEPVRTQMDLNFNLFGFPVRIDAWFWLAAMLLGWRGSSGLAESSNGQYTVFHFLVLWILAVLISILVHEMGHGFAMRRYGIRSHLVLYHFGGLAVPDETYSAWGQTRADDPRNSIIISAAGPLAGFVLAGLVAGGIFLAGYRIPFEISVLGLRDFRLDVPYPPLMPRVFFYYMLMVNVYWGILNLLPIYPLDGGQIARNLFVLFGGRNAVVNSLILSILVGAVVAVLAFSSGRTFIGIMLALLAYSSYQTYASYTSRRGPW